MLPVRQIVNDTIGPQQPYFATGVSYVQNLVITAGGIVTTAVVPNLPSGPFMFLTYSPDQATASTTPTASPSTGVGPHNNNSRVCR